MVDTQGFLLAVSVWADAASGGELVDWVASCYGWTLEIVRKSADQKEVKGFAVQPHRWIMERTFAWLCKYRCLGRDYEFLTGISEAMLRLAMCHLMARRLEPRDKTT